MEKEFVPYEQALALKELGFDEPCLAFSYTKSEFGYIAHSVYLIDYLDTDSMVKNSEKEYYYARPTFSQAFRWFRERYGYHIELFVDDDKTFGFMISYFTKIERLDKPVQRKYVTHEEAELECLETLIELLKEK
jgi:hypothetical protein